MQVMSTLRPDLLVFSPVAGPRLHYTLDVLIGHFPEATYSLTKDPAEYRSWPGPKINYGAEALEENELRISATGLLSEGNIRVIRPEVFQYEGLPALFPAPADGQALPFDLFSAAFFLLSRYEEYLPFTADALGRFPSGESLAARGGFLQMPVVDRWALLLAEKLKQWFPSFTFRTGIYRFQPTIDVDIAWAYRHRPWWRAGMAFARDALQGRRAMLRERIAVLSGRTQDPYDTYGLLDQVHARSGAEPVYFFLLGDYGPKDPNLPHRSLPVRDLIAHISGRYPVGLHPSFRSNKGFRQLSREKQRLEALTSTRVTRSRQHYLMLRFPDTYRQLEKAGIESDYSMGYADNTGFRAGTARPFPWYDLRQERCSNLWIHPFQVMDVTLRQYLGLNPEEATGRIESLIRECRAVGGTFCSLWHNSSFATTEGWGPWKAVYEDLNALAKP